jgi:hypothetical protein
VAGTKIDFSNIKTGNDYLETRKNLIKEIQAILDKKGDKGDSAKIADDYLAEHQKQNYLQYNELSEALSAIERQGKKWGEKPSNLSLA